MDNYDDIMNNHVEEIDAEHRAYMHAGLGIDDDVAYGMNSKGI